MIKDKSGGHIPIRSKYVVSVSLYHLTLGDISPRSTCSYSCSCSLVSHVITVRLLFTPSCCRYRLELNLEMSLKQLGEQENVVIDQSTTFLDNCFKWYIIEYRSYSSSYIIAISSSFLHSRWFHSTSDSNPNVYSHFHFSVRGSLGCCCADFANEYYISYGKNGTGKELHVKEERCVSDQLSYSCSS